MQQIFGSIYTFFRRHRWLCWSLFFASFGISAFFAGRLRYVQDLSSMLPEHRSIRAMNDVISHTQAGEQVLFMMSFDDSSRADPDSLISAAEDLKTHMIRQCGSWIDTVSMQPGGGYEETLSAIFRDHLPLFLTEADFISVDTLIAPDRIEQTLENNRRILLSPASIVYKQIVADDPVGISGVVWKKLNNLRFDPGYETYDGYLFSDSLRKLSFFLEPRFSAAETQENGKFFRQLDETISRWQEEHAHIHVVYFGGPAVAAGNALQMRTDTVVTLSITVVLLIALTFYYFRRKRIPLLLLVPVLYGAVTGLGVLYLVQGSISLIALGAGAVIMGIAIDFSIHFLSHALHTRQLHDTVRELAHPLTIGSFTTVAAFLSLTFAHTPILRDLGLFAAASLAGAAVCTLVFLPHFPLGLAAARRRPTVFDALGSKRPEKNKWLLLFIVLFTPVMLYFSFDVQFDNELMNLNYLSPKLRQAQDEVSRENAFALSSVFLVADEKDEEHALQQLELLSPDIETLKRKGWVRSESNPTVFIPSLKEQRARLERWNAYWTPARKDSVLRHIHAAAQKHGFRPDAFKGFETLLNSGFRTMNRETADVLKTFYPGSFSAAADNRYAIVALKVPAAYRDSVFRYLSDQEAVAITDRKQGATQLVQILNDDFQSIALYSSLIVFFALLIGYGRIELAVMSFLPLVISWVWILGLMSLLGLKFNIVNIIISSLIFGLGDDYSIFTTDGLVERYKYGSDKLRSVRSAVYLSVATVIIGLGVLLLARHPALQSIAFISVLGILCVLFISQTLQPFLFDFFIQSRANRKYLPFTLFSFAKSVFAFAYFFTGSLVLTALGFLFTKLWPFNREKGKYYLHVCLSKYTWSMMYIMVNVRKRVINRKLADFAKPAVYIANHSSFLDILVTTMLHPRLVLLTNRWVWRSPVFGILVRMAEYYPVADGAEDSIGPLRDLVNRGYSIVVFPEGTRSYDDTIHRFHKGAFYIAEKLHLDIAPLILHGVGNTMQKGDFLLKDSTSSVYFYPRIAPGDLRYGENYSERAKYFGRWMRGELERIKEREETPAYFRERLLRSYTYKGPVLEWYCRIKIRLEGYYEQFHALLPRSGYFYDLGCGYGFMSYMLHWAAPSRQFTGVDYDEEKIATAQGNFLRDDRIGFEQGDLTQFHPQPCDGIVISDVLHYLIPEEQEKLMERCIGAIRNGGVLIVRDGVSELKERHKGTRLTELFSTRIFRFNKTRNELHFISRRFMTSFAERHKLELEIVDNTRFTSNLIFVMRKPGISSS